MQSPRPHFNTLDGIRGVAALLVVIFHGADFFGAHPFPETYLAVDVFFLLSGAVVANAYESRLRDGMSFARFAWIRLVRIYPLYLFGFTLGVVAITWSHARLEGGLPLSLVDGLLLLPTLSGVLFPFNMPSWSLSVELFGNLAYAAALRWLDDRMLMIVMAACAAGMAAVLWLSPRHLLDMGVTRVLFYVGYVRFGYAFCAGVLLYRCFMRYRGPRYARVSSPIAWLVLLCVAAVLMGAPPPKIAPWYDFFAVVLAFPLLILWGMHYRAAGLHARVFDALGLLSYPIYVLHDPLMKMGRHASLAWRGVAISTYAPVAGWLLLLTVVVSAWLVAVHYDAPLRAWLMKPGRLRRGAHATGSGR